MTALLGTTTDDIRSRPSMAERITLIMEAFDRPRTVRTVDEVAALARLPRSTTYRILDQLARLRWVDRTAAGYRLGQRSLGLGGREIDHTALRAAAAPELHELALRTGLVVHLAVLDGTDVHILDKVGGRAAARVPTRVGGRVPAHCTALGRAVLAGLDPERVDLEYPRTLLRRTQAGIGDRDRLHRELARVRANGGLAFERGEFAAHLACVGTAVRVPGGAAGALSLVGDAGARTDRFAPLVIRAAGVIAENMLDGSGHPAI